MLTEIQVPVLFTGLPVPIPPIELLVLVLVTEQLVPVLSLKTMGLEFPFFIPTSLQSVLLSRSCQGQVLIFDLIYHSVLIIHRF